MIADRASAAASASPEREPYVGLRPFDVAEADLFFGRQREVWELTSLLLSSRLVVVYGPVNIGKTSLLQAGVLAGLPPDVAQVLPVARLPRLTTTPAAQAAAAQAAAPVAPTAGPAGAVNTPTPVATPTSAGVDADPSFVQAMLSGWTAASPVALRRLTLARYLKGLPVRTSPDDEDVPLPLVVVIDQFEEIFADDSAVGIRCRDELLGQIREALVQVGHLHVTVCLRHEAIGHLLPHEATLSPGGLRRYRLGGLDRAHAAAAVRGPLAPTGRFFAPGVAEDLVDRIVGWTTSEVAGDVRPVVDPARLQVVCLALWRSLEDGVTAITSEVIDACFDDAGDVETTLTTFCVRAVIDAAATHEMSELDLWAWLEHTFITELGTRGSAHRGPSTTAGMPNALAESLEEHLILRSEKRAGALWFELQHDVLIEPIRSGRRLAEDLAAGDANPAPGTQPLPPAGGVGPEAYLRMARRALRDGLLPLAEEYARGAIRASARDPRRLAEANVFLGELVLDQATASVDRERADEMYDTAEDNFRRAAELFDAEQDARAVGRQQASLGKLFLRRGRYTDALAELRGALDRLRGDLDVRLDFARALSRAGQTKAAVGEYTAVLMFVPEDAPAIRAQALLARGLLEAENGDPAAALHDLDDAVRSQPDLATSPEMTTARARATARLDRRRPTTV